MRLLKHPCMRLIPLTLSTARTTDRHILKNIFTAMRAAMCFTLVSPPLVHGVPYFSNHQQPTQPNRYGTGIHQFIHPDPDASADVQSS